MVEYFDASNKDVTPLPLYVPGWEELEKNQAASSEAKGKSKSRYNYKVLLKRRQWFDKKRPDIFKTSSGEGSHAKFSLG